MGDKSRVQIYEKNWITNNLYTNPIFPLVSTIVFLDHFFENPDNRNISLSLL